MKIEFNLARLSDVVRSQVLIITDEQVSALYLDEIKKYLPSCDEFILPADDGAKSWQQAEKTLSYLLESQYRRATSSIVALGGGVVTDLAGFVASVYQRGVQLFHVPTTLLAQVDAAIGGKTAVNFLGMKNMVGSFYHADTVFLDVAFLKSLPEREFNAGLAEVIKYSLLDSKLPLAELKELFPNLLRRDESVLQDIVQRCCEIKMRIVQEDERDYGLRQILNLGHTWAHALESVLDFTILHGEAVAQGLLLALRLSEKHCQLERGVYEQVFALLQEAKLLRELPELDKEKLKVALGHDKKNQQAGMLNMVLLDDVAKPRMIKVSVESLVG